MDFLSPIVGPVVESLLVPVKKHLGYLFSSMKHVRNMSNKMKQLHGASDDVKKHMETNNIRNLEIPARVPDWLEEVKNIEKDAERISSNVNGCFNLKMRYQAGRKAFKITEQIEGLIKENIETSWSDAQKPLGKVSFKKASTSGPSDGDTQNDFKSRDKIFKDALGFLQQDHKVQVISLCGMGGVGKTTMMEQLKKAVEDKNMFDYVVKVVIGQKMNTFSIQQTVAASLGISITETSGTAADRLRKTFEKMSQESKEKVLVILDDVWEKVELKDIGLSPLPNGFKLLLTSRDEKVCTQIAVDAKSDLRVVGVNEMKEEEANNFFCQITGVSEKNDRDLNNIGVKIVRRCGFLPLAIKLIATNLKSEEKSVWRDTLRRLKKKDLDIVQEIVEISYTFIKEEDVKAIFLLCGLFPDDYNIPIEDLTRYAWGLKLLNEVPTLGEARDRTKTCVGNLKKANLLMDSDYLECVKMHDLVLAFVVAKVSKGDNPWIVNHGDVSNWSRPEMSESCRRISLTCMGLSEFPEDFNHPNVSLLRLMNGDKSLKFPQDFYEKMQNLQVMAYEKLQYPLLPRSFQCSTNLKTLCLHECSLMFDCSPIGDHLLNLEVLSFAHSGIRYLPSAIGNLKKLKLLDLTGCMDLRIEDGVLNNLVKLEELYMRVADEKGFKFTDMNYKELAERSKTLSALEIEFVENNPQLKNMSYDKLERFKISLGRLLEANSGKDTHSSENTLMLVTKKDEVLESGMNELFQKTQVLYLEAVCGMNNLVEVLTESVNPRHSFDNLRVLNVSKCADLRYLFTVPVVSGLVKLERLTISMCPVMEVLVYSENGEKGADIRFQELKHLYLYRLPMLVGFSNTEDVINLPQLVDLELDALPNITSIYPEYKSAATSVMSSTSSNSSAIIRPFFNKEVMIPRLGSLRIYQMKALKNIWPCGGSAEVDTCLLREIRVEFCDNLVNMFPRNPMPLLHHLETIWVRNCGSIEVIFEIDDAGEIKKERGSSKLRSIQVRGSGKLREVWRLKDVINHPDVIISGFQAVERIRIVGCKSFTNIFTPTTTRFDLGADIYTDGGGYIELIEENDFKSREKIFKDALGFLQQDQKVQVIAICGMHGVGKTTMMEQLKKDAEDKKMFDWVVKEVIGQKVNTFSIQKNVAEYLGHSLTETSKAARADRLRTIFGNISQESKKKVLVILDDVWEVIDLKDIGLSPLPNGFKLLLTSRNENVCRHIAVEANSDLKVVRVNVMEELEANNFFCQITGVSKENDPELNDMGVEIVRRCGFLPFAIKLIATALNSQEKFVWRDTLLRLKKKHLDFVQEIVEISYTFIKEEDVKAIFLLCGLFPDDYNIPIENLTRYAWGLKLFNKVPTLGDARDRTKTCVLNLKKANLLIDSDYPECVKMHDLVLAFVVDKVSKGDHPWIINHSDFSNWSRTEMSESCTGISLTCMGMSEFPRDFNHPNVSLLRLMNGDKSLKFPEDFYEKRKKLQVIAYEKLQYPLLPRSLQCSTNLKTLCLHQCLLMPDCSPIGDHLLNLEVLSFAHSGIRYLPSAIGNLMKLKLLDLTGCIDLHIDEGVFKNLAKLEELYMRVADKKGVRFTGINYKELEERSKNLCALEVEFFEKNRPQSMNMSYNKLERFKISIGRFLEPNGGNDIYSSENTLKLVAKKDEVLESGMNELFQKTEVLLLEEWGGMNNLEEVLPKSVNPQHSFVMLRVLKVSKCADLRYLFTVPVASGLVKLESLAISECPVMKALVYSQNVDQKGVDIMFQKLKHLDLEDLPKLVGLSNSTNDVIDLPQLVELVLDGLPNFTSIYPEYKTATSSVMTSSSAIIKPFFNQEVMIPRLEILRIHRMEALKNIWPCGSSEEVVDACLLRYISVDSCDNLVNMFPRNPMPLLHHLETIFVENCGSIEVIFEIDDVGEIKKERGSSNLRSIHVRGSGKLREVWRLKGVINHPDVIICGFQALQQIIIEGCERFRNIFTPTTARFDLAALRKKCITHCTDYDESEEENNVSVQESK